METSSSIRRANIREKYLERQNTVRSKLIPGSLIHAIINGTNTKPPEREKFYVQNAESYVNLLKKNYEYYGVPFKRPNVEEMPPYENSCKKSEDYVEYLDKIKVDVTVLKNGKVRVKILPQMAILNEKYYSKYKVPPIKAVLSTLKSMGCSSEYIETVANKHKKRQELIKLKWKKLEKILDAPSVSSSSRKKGTAKKVKKVEKEEEIEKDEIEIENDEDDNEDNEDDNEEDGGMEVEIDEDDQEIVGDVEEYISDGDD